MTIQRTDWVEEYLAALDTTRVCVVSGTAVVSGLSDDVGQIELGAGAVTITVKPTKKPGLAVMDLRRIELKPAR